MCCLEDVQILSTWFQFDRWGYFGLIVLLCEKWESQSRRCFWVSIIRVDDHWSEFNGEREEIGSKIWFNTNDAYVDSKLFRISALFLSTCPFIGPAITAILEEDAEEAIDWFLRSKSSFLALAKIFNSSLLHSILQFSLDSSWCLTSLCISPSFCLNTE